MVFITILLPASAAAATRYPQMCIRDRLNTINGVEVDIVFSNVALHFCGEMLVQLLLGPLAVQQEAAALFQILHHVVLMDIGGLVAGDEVSLADRCV